MNPVPWGALRVAAKRESRMEGLSHTGASSRGKGTGSEVRWSVLQFGFYH